jgi:hypothetical protein
MRSNCPLPALDRCGASDTAIVRMIRPLDVPVTLAQRIRGERMVGIAGSSCGATILDGHEHRTYPDSRADTHRERLDCRPALRRLPSRTLQEGRGVEANKSLFPRGKGLEAAAISHGLRASKCVSAMTNSLRDANLQSRVGLDLAPWPSSFHAARPSARIACTDHAEEPMDQLFRRFS